MKPPKQKTQIQLQEEIDTFNLHNKVGDTVNVKLDNGDISHDIIRYPATIMGGHTAMAWLEKRGSYLLSRVTKLK